MPERHSGRTLRGSGDDLDTVVPREITVATPERFLEGPSWTERLGDARPIPRDLIDEGHTFTSSEFMQHFFFLTGMHAIHLLIGFVVLGVLVRQLADPRRRSLTTIETCSTYWHTVDLYWVIIFALLYVVR